MGRKAREEKKSAMTSQLPDDTPIPDPVCTYSLSKLDSTDYRGSSCSFMSLGKNSPSKCKTVENSPPESYTVPDLELTDSSSLFVDDDGHERTLKRSPSVLFNKSYISSIEFLEDSYISSYKKIIDSGRRSSIKEKMLRVGKSRSNSSDNAYSDGNEVFRMSISELESSDERESPSFDENVEEELPFLNLTKDKLSTGVLGTTSSKPHLNCRLKPYDRHRGKLARKSWKGNSFVTGALVRAATSGSVKRTPKPVLKEKQANQKHWSVRVLPLSFCKSSEPVGQEEAKSDTRGIPMLTSSVK